MEFIFRLCLWVNIFSFGWCVMFLFGLRIFISMLVGFSLVSMVRFMLVLVWLVWVSMLFGWVISGKMWFGWCRLAGLVLGFMVVWMVWVWL